MNAFFCSMERDRIIPGRAVNIECLAMHPMMTRRLRALEVTEPSYMP